MTEWNTYKTWSGMIQRCHNPASKSFGAYGNKGVQVCDRWRFGEGDLTGHDAFALDIGERPSPEHSVDRIDPAGNYEPSNVRWATAKQQARNRRNHTVVSHNGETMILPEWCERFGAVPCVVRSRLKRGTPVEKALRMPCKPQQMLQGMIDEDEYAAFMDECRLERISMSAGVRVAAREWVARRVANRARRVAKTKEPVE